MEKNEYRKAEFYLYNYLNTKDLIEKVEQEIIDNINISGNSWIKGITENNNTLENQVIKLIENKKIMEIKRWQVLNKEVLVFLFEKYPMYYKFLKMKYLDKLSIMEIQDSLKIDFERQKNIKDKLVVFIINLAKKRNLV